MRKTLVTALLLALCAAPVWAAANVRLVQQQGTDLVHVSLPTSGSKKAAVHKIEIDDAFAFRTPVLTRTFRQSLDFRSYDAGLMPGVHYHVRIDGRSTVQEFRLSVGSFHQPEVNCKLLRQTWEQTGRLMTGVAFSGVRWDASSSRWAVVPHTYLNGQSIYSAELYLRPAVNAAQSCNDSETLDEVAQYYLLMLQQTEPLGALLKRPNVLPETRERMAVVDQSARTFAAPFGDKAGEGELYNVQWLHPAAKLVRLISLLPPEQRTTAMKTFAAEYTRFIVAEQLSRYLAQQRLPAPGGGYAQGRVEVWNLAMRGLKGRQPWDTAMSDIDLWLLASAAEMLGAHANDPVVAPLDAKQIAMLHSALQTGVRFFQSKRTEYPETKNFRGERVGSASYFNGDYTAHPDFDYSAITSERFPAPTEKRVLAAASWDISHAYRLPIFLRALYENRKATGLDFPRYRDLELVANQYVYRVFNGDFSRPLFHNYFDGSDGWHRVGFNGQGFGYPPSRYCDQRNDKQPCLTPGNIIGWGELAFANPDLQRLEQALVKLAFDEQPGARQFRDRYYYYNDSAYQVITAEGKQIYGTALYFVIAENAGMLANGAEMTANKNRLR